MFIYCLFLSKNITLLKILFLSDFIGLDEKCNLIKNIIMHKFLEENQNNSNNLINKYEKLSGIKGYIITNYNNTEKNYKFTIEHQNDVILLPPYKRSKEILITMDKDTQAYSQVKSILKLIKERKIGNCSEASFLALISARVNGVKNCVTAFITSPNGFNYDHSIILVEDEKPYIIDAWLGFADYVPNAIKRYQKDFKNCFDFKEAKTNEMIIKPDEYSVFADLNDSLQKKDIRKMKKIAPNLVLKKD
jgi:hypothetical protein